MLVDPKTHSSVMQARFSIANDSAPADILVPVLRMPLKCPDGRSLTTTNCAQ